MSALPALELCPAGRRSAPPVDETVSRLRFCVFSRTPSRGDTARRVCHQRPLVRVHAEPASTGPAERTVVGRGTQVLKRQARGLQQRGSTTPSLRPRPRAAPTSGRPQKLQDTVAPGALLTASDEQALALAAHASYELERLRERLCSERTAAGMRAADSMGALEAVAVGALEVGAPTEVEWARAAGLRSVAELRDALTAGRRARSTLVTRNMGLAVKAASLAVGRAGCALGMADLVQEGAAGLLRATETFDPERRYHFSTYAYGWVRSSIQRAIQNEGRTVRIPVWLYEVQARLLAARAELRLRGVKAPSAAQLAAETGLAEERVRAALSHFSPQVSLDAELGSHMGNSRPGSLSDQVAGVDAPGAAALAERDAEAARARSDLLDLLDTLLDGERLVLRAHFGIDGGAASSVSELARQLGVKPTTVSALLASGLRKLRHPQRRAMLPQLSGHRD